MASEVLIQQSFDERRRTARRAVTGNERNSGGRSSDLRLAGVQGSEFRVERYGQGCCRSTAWGLLRLGTRKTVTVEEDPRLTGGQTFPPAFFTGVATRGCRWPRSPTGWHEWLTRLADTATSTVTREEAMPSSATATGAGCELIGVVRRRRHGRLPSINKHAHPPPSAFKLSFEPARENQPLHRAAGWQSNYGYVRRGTSPMRRRIPLDLTAVFS